MFLITEITKAEQWILFERKIGRVKKRIKDRGRVEISVTKLGSTNSNLFYHSGFHLRKQKGTNCFIQLLKKTEEIVTMSTVVRPLI